jgi:protein PhnA
MSLMTSRALLMDEMDMRREEERIPELAAKAGRAAHERAMQLRGKLTMVVGENLVEKRSDGTITVLKHIGEPAKSKPGLVLRRKK